MTELIDTKRPSILLLSLKFGLLCAVSAIGVFFITIATGDNPFEGGPKSWLSTVFAVLIVALAHQSYKKNGTGFMAYSEAFGIAFLILSISIIVSGTFIYVYSTQIEPNLVSDIWTKAQSEMEKSGQKESADFALGFAKKFFWAFYFAGRFIGALITSLIVAIFTQKKNPEPFS